jgi:hypothetical protein
MTDLDPMHDGVPSVEPGQHLPDDVAQVPPLGRRARLWAIGYVVGAAILTTAAYLTQNIAWPLTVAFAVVIFVYLGPIGVGAGLLVGIVAAFVLAGVAGPSAAVIWGVGAAAVAAINVAVVLRWRRRAARVGGRIPFAAWDRLIGGFVFVLAGVAFVVLCFVAGATALLAHGVDVSVPEAQAAPIVRAAGLVWWPGLVVAVAGLVAWIMLARRRRRLLPWAIVALAIQIALILVLAITTPMG